MYILHKGPSVLDSSLLSPQSSVKSQVYDFEIHFPFLHWNSDVFWQAAVDFSKICKKFLDCITQFI